MEGQIALAQCKSSFFSILPQGTPHWAWKQQQLYTNSWQGVFSGDTLPGNKSALMSVILCLPVFLRIAQRFSPLPACVCVCVCAINELAEIDEIVAAVKTPHDFRAFPRWVPEILDFVVAKIPGSSAQLISMQTKHQEHESTVWFTWNILLLEAH